MNDRINLGPALRQAADLLEAHPEFPEPYVTTLYGGRAQLAWYLSINHGSNLAQQKASAAAIVRTLGGDWAKKEQGDNFNYRQTTGLLDLLVQVDRPAVCERIVVGTEKVTIPAVEAQPERTETVEKVEWRCQPLLADDQADVETKPAVA